MKINFHSIFLFALFLILLLNQMSTQKAQSSNSDGDFNDIRKFLSLDSQNFLESQNSTNYHNNRALYGLKSSQTFEDMVTSRGYF